jgi:hypothetical protein
VVSRRDPFEIHQERKPFLRMSWDGGSGPLVDGSSTYAAYVVSYPFSADQDSSSGQVLERPSAAAVGIIQIEGIDPGHDPQRRFTYWHRPLIER